MSALVTLPGDIPGLLREGAPTDDGVVLSHHGDWLWLVSRASMRTEHARLSDRSLLLSEPAGRDIAVRWIAEKLGVETGLTAPMFDMSERGVWVLTCGWEPLRRWFFHPDPDYGCGNTNWSAVPGLPNDCTQGIEALRLIVLHLAGRQP